MPSLAPRPCALAAGFVVLASAAFAACGAVGPAAPTTPAPVTDRASAQPATTAIEPLASTVTWTLASRALGEDRTINLYTPPGLDPDVLRHATLLVIPDGGLEEDFLHVAEAVHFGIQWGLLRPIVLVGVENTERRRDLTGPTEVDSDRRVAPRVGGSAAFRAFLREELLPAVRARTACDGPRAIMGESLAGLFALETMLREPDLFTTTIAFSPSVWWNDRALTRELEGWLRAHRDLRARLYVTCADETDIAPDVRAMRDALAREAGPGLEWSVLPRPDEFHDTIYRASAPRALRVLFPAELNDPAGHSGTR